MTALLEVDGLTVGLYGGGGYTPVVRDVSLSIAAGGTLGIVGESGCGKTMSTMALVGLLPDYAEVAARSVRWKGEEVGLAGLRAMRGSRIAFVFQDPMTALNPLMKVGRQVAETIRTPGSSRAQRRATVVDLLSEVGLAEPERCAQQYPWELSGGMAQRVLIAMALASEPDLLIADEPTTAIDASMRKRVLGLIGRIQRARGLAVMLISHDLAVVRSQADDIAVMYAGRIVEVGPTAFVAGASRHPYTQALIDCTLDPFRASDLAPIAGEPPRPEDLGTDCSFRSRCPRASSVCDHAPSLLRGAGSMSAVACWNAAAGVTA